MRARDSAEEADLNPVAQMPAPLLLSAFSAFHMLVLRAGSSVSAFPLQRRAEGRVANTGRKDASLSVVTTIDGGVLQGCRAADPGD